MKLTLDTHAARTDPIARHGLSAFLRTKGVHDPDGRKLFDYAVSPEELASLVWYVRAHEAFVWKDRDCAALVLILAEWTHQRATSLHRFWEEAFEGLGLVFRDGPKHFYERLEIGLSFWKRGSQTGRRNWLATLVVEGGFPRNLIAAGFDELLDVLFANFSWSFLASAHGRPQHSTKITQEILRRKGQSRFGEFASDAAAPAITNLVTAFAVYRRDLKSGARPTAAEGLEEWLARLQPEERPEHLLPFRDSRDKVFAGLLFPRLRSGVAAGGYVQPYREKTPPPLLLGQDTINRWSAPEPDEQQVRSGTRLRADPASAMTEAPTPSVAPVSMSLVWPADCVEPLVRVRIPVDGLPKTWIERVAPGLSASSRIALGPAGSLALAQTLEAEGDAFQPTSGQTWSWPLTEIRGRALCFSRRSFRGLHEVPIEIAIPCPSVILADPEGRSVNSRELRGGIEYRVWFPRAPRRFSGVAERITANTFRLRGSDEERALFETDEDHHEFVLSSTPLNCELSGRRWISHGALGPYIGLPILRASPTEPIEFRTSRTNWERMRGGPEYSLPVLGTNAGAIRAFVRAGVRSTELRFSYLPPRTTFRLLAPAADGTRLLSVVSPGLVFARVLLDDDDVCDCKPDDESSVALTLPSIDGRCRYRVVLSYGDSSVSAPLWDVRREFSLNLGADDAVGLPTDGQEVPVIERAIARFSSIGGTGLLPDEKVELRVRSFNPERRFERKRQLVAATADRSGEFTLNLAAIVDELEPCARHELTLLIHDSRRLAWRLDIDDTVFAKEPDPGMPYGALAARSALRSPPPLWGWVPAARQWESIQFSPMIETANGWMPPVIDLPAGGILAAPFDASHRVAYLRYVVGPPLADSNEDPLIAALAKPRGFDLNTLRSEFAAGVEQRERLRAIMINLSAFDATASLAVPSTCTLDGAMLAYAALRSDASAGSDGSLRAIPAGAWLRACDAVLQDEGSWANRLYDCVPEALLLIVVLSQAGLPLEREHSNQMRQFEEHLATRRPSTSRAQSEPADVDLHTAVTLLDYERRLPSLLDDWRRGDREALREHTIDPELLEYGRPHQEVRAYLAQRYPGMEHFIEAPLALASAAARTTLDHSLSGSERRLLRSMMYAQRQVRAWDRFEPLVGALYAFSLCAYWMSMRSVLSSPELARRHIEQIEVQ